MDENVRLTYSFQRAVAVVTKSSGGESLPGYDAVRVTLYMELFSAPLALALRVAPTAL